MCALSVTSSMMRQDRFFWTRRSDLSPSVAEDSGQNCDLGPHPGGKWVQKQLSVLQGIEVNRKDCPTIVISVHCLTMTYDDEWRHSSDKNLLLQGGRTSGRLAQRNQAWCITGLFTDRAHVVHATRYRPRNSSLPKQRRICDSTHRKVKFTPFGC